MPVRRDPGPGRLVPGGSGARQHRSRYSAAAARATAAARVAAAANASCARHRLAQLAGDVAAEPAARPPEPLPPPSWPWPARPILATAMGSSGLPGGRSSWATRLRRSTASPTASSDQRRHRRPRQRRQAGEGRPHGQPRDGRADDGRRPAGCGAGSASRFRLPSGRAADPQPGAGHRAARPAPCRSAGREQVRDRAVAGDLARRARCRARAPARRPARAPADAAGSAPGRR